MPINEELAQEILQIVYSYIFSRPETDRFEEGGCQILLYRIRKAVNARRPIHIILPAFPMKSPSPDKVFNSLPDMGEVMGLSRLYGLCLDIARVYKHGATASIVSDGIVYCDLIGVSDESRIGYHRALKSLCKQLGFSDLISFETTASMAVKLGIRSSDWMVNASSSEIREMLLSCLPAEYDVDEAIAKYTNVHCVYCGFIKFLSEDLKNNDDVLAIPSRNQRKKYFARIAKKMIIRGECFSQLIKNAFPESIRLSIHAHDNSGEKLAFSLLPGQKELATPWHNVTVFSKDGSLQFKHRSAIDEDTYQVVQNDGKDWFYIEKEMLNGLPDGVELWPVYPFGVMVKCQSSITINMIPGSVIRELGFTHSLVIFRGFLPCNDHDDMRKSAADIGSIQKWVFGDILVVKKSSQLDLNNVLTDEAMPMHFDGIFKVKTTETGEVVSDSPVFQYFHCKHASTSHDGFTLFSKTNSIVSYFELSDSNLQCRVFTPINESFGGQELVMPLVQRHPQTGVEYLRYHEPWNPSNKQSTSTQPTFVEIEPAKDDPPAYINLHDHLVRQLYSRQHCVYHSWEVGDFILADNFSLLHTRTAFNDPLRELWRIHIN